MTVQQIYALMNSVTSEILGDSAVISEDLSNVVDIGTEIFNANAVDNYVRSLVNHIARGYDRREDCHHALRASEARRAAAPRIR